MSVVSAGVRQVARVGHAGERVALRAGRGALGRAVGLVDDRTIERIGSNDRVLAALFATLARMVAVNRPNLTSDIRIVVDVDGEPRTWSLRARAGQASARRGEVDDPDLTLRLTLADLLGLATGRTTGVTLAATGRIQIEGDLVAALALMRAAEGAPPA